MKSERPLYCSVFNVIIILKHPDVISPSSYRDTHAQRTHPKSSESVPRTLNMTFIYSRMLIKLIQDQLLLLKMVFIGN